jgi:DNA polymerase delta subunit 1
MGHVALVERLRERDVNSAPKPGDRIPFVYINTGNPLDTSAKKTEDPGYVEENGVPIDYLYYYEHQLLAPIENIFNIILGEEKCKQILYQRKTYIDAKKREKSQIAEQKRIREGNKDIRNYFNTKST